MQGSQNSISVESPFMVGFCGIYKDCKRANLRSLCHDDRICPILNLPDFKFGIAGAPSEAWRFLRGERPCRTRPNQPIVPSVAVMKEAAKSVREVTVNRENLGVEEGMTATSTSLEP